MTYATHYTKSEPKAVILLDIVGQRIPRKHKDADIALSSRLDEASRHKKYSVNPIFHHYLREL